MMKEDLSEKYNMCAQSSEVILKDSLTKIQPLGGNIKSTPAKRSKYVIMRVKEQIM